MATKCNRKNAVSRNSIEQVVTIDGTIAQMINYCSGGMGIVISKKGLHDLRLTTEKMVVVRFNLCDTQIKAHFVVKNINSDRRMIGLQYADGKQLSPQQRIIVCQNSV